MSAAGAAEDPFLWLEDVEGDEALDWVRAQNERSLGVLEGDARYERLYEDAKAIHTATDRIPYGIYADGTIHNFWQDAGHVRGLLRRIDLDGYKAADPDWEIVLDLDALAEEEGENWVYGGRTFLPPKNDRCLIALSRGGSDASVMREFDMGAKAFIEDGFVLPEGKQWGSYLDADTLLIATPHGGGTTNSSGYPRQIRRWRRGTPIEAADLVYESAETDAMVRPYVSHRPEGRRALLVRLPDFFHQQVFALDDDGTPTPLPLPDDVDLQGVFGPHLLAGLRSDWSADGRSFPSGSLVSIDLDATLRAEAPSGVRLVAAQPERGTIASVSTTKDRVYIGMLDTVTGRLVAAQPPEDGDGDWRTEPVPLDPTGSLTVVSADSFSETVLVDFQSFLTPATLNLMRDGRAPEPIKALPARFDPEPFQAEQHVAVSADGTEVPYFLLSPREWSGDGPLPTILYGYGGFEVSLSPTYLGPLGKAWLEAGGAYAIANIRGGGEFGPAWHQAALKANRQRAFDDFIAVAETLVETGVTAPDRLGISGGSNGGLLVGAAMTQRPELFAGVFCAVPLLDMLRYHKLLAGASWIGEYGDPDVPDERAWIEAYSPYQKLAAGTRYPRMFLATSTKDDRVHPGHARKMAAKMMSQDHDVLYYENIEGGHSAAADLLQLARRDALATVFFLDTLGL